MFNSIAVLKEDLKNMLLDLITKELEASIDYCLLTHNIKPIIKIREILNSTIFEE